MNRSEVAILNLLASRGPLSFHGLTPDESAALYRLVALGYVERGSVDLERRVDGLIHAWRITNAGRSALSEYHEEKDRRDRNRKSERHKANWRKHIPALGWVLTVVGTILATIAAHWIIRRLGW